MRNSKQIGTRLARLGLVCLGLAVTLAGCSLGNASLSTGSLFGSGGDGKPAEAPVAKAATPADRALHAGATSARAQRCGYVFDPAATRSAFLAYEAGQGTAGDLMAKTEKSYDYTVASIAKTVAANEAYCDDEQTAIIKRDLSKMLAGDFSAPSKAASFTSQNWWGGPAPTEKFNYDKALQRDKAL